VLLVQQLRAETKSSRLCTSQLSYARRYAEWGVVMGAAPRLHESIVSFRYHSPILAAIISSLILLADSLLREYAQPQSRPSLPTEQ